MRCFVERPARPGGRIETIDQTERKPLRTGPGDHDGIVAAEFYRRRDQAEAAARRLVGKGGANGLVGGNTAGDDEGGLTPTPLIPAKAGTRVSSYLDCWPFEKPWVPAFAGMSGWGA